MSGGVGGLSGSGLRAWSRGLGLSRAFFIWDRCANGKMRRAHGVVEALHADGRMCVGWPDEAGCATTFPASAWAPMAHAGALSSVPAELCGAALVGRRIRVYWPGMDAMYGAASPHGMLTSVRMRQSTTTVRCCVRRWRGRTGGRALCSMRAHSSSEQALSI